MRDVICSLIATTETVTGYRAELSLGHFVDTLVVVVEGSPQIWTPPNQQLAKLALNHP